MRTRSLLVLILLTAAVLAAIWWTSRPLPETSVTGQGEPLLPELMETLDQVRRVHLVWPDGGLTLQGSRTGWRVAGAGYPANAGGVRDLVLSLAELRIVEPKTADPSRYAELQVDNPETSPEAQGRLIVLEKADGTALTQLIVGKVLSDPEQPQRPRAFVRRADEPRAWLVEGHLPLGERFTPWLDNPVLDIDTGRFHRLRLAPHDGEAVTIELTRNGFDLTERGPDEVLQDPFGLNMAVGAMVYISAQDVRQRTPAGEPLLTAKLDTKDGLRITARFVREAPQIHWVQLAAEAMVSEAGTPEPTVAEEASRLNNRWSKRWFRVSGETVSALNRQVGDWIER